MWKTEVCRTERAAPMKKTKTRNKRAHNPPAIGQISPNGTSFANAAACMAEIGKGFHGRGWLLGTSGNFSAVISRQPLRLSITSTSLDKGCLPPQQVRNMHAAANALHIDRRP